METMDVHVGYSSFPSAALRKVWAVGGVLSGCCSLHESLHPPGLSEGWGWGGGRGSPPNHPSTPEALPGSTHLSFIMTFIPHPGGTAPI